MAGSTRVPLPACPHRTKPAASPSPTASPVLDVLRTDIDAEGRHGRRLLLDVMLRSSGARTSAHLLLSELDVKIKQETLPICVARDSLAREDSVHCVVQAAMSFDK